MKSHADVWQRLYNGALEREKKIFDREKRLHHTIFAHPTTSNRVRDTSKSNGASQRGCTPRYIQLYADAMCKIKINNESRKAKALQAVRVANNSIDNINPTTNACCNRLYDLSQSKRTIGKIRRNEIEKRSNVNNSTIHYPLNSSKKKASRQSESPYKIRYAKPIHEKNACELQAGRERDNILSGKVMTTTSTSSLPKKIGRHVSGGSLKKNQSLQKEKREHKSEIKANSRTLDHIKKSSAYLSSRVLDLYESGKQKIRMERNSSASSRVSTIIR